MAGRSAWAAVARGGANRVGVRGRERLERRMLATQRHRLDEAISHVRPAP